MKFIYIYVILISATLFGCTTQGPTNNQVSANLQPAANTQQGANSENCRETRKEEIAELFNVWNKALESGVKEDVADLYAENSILLPTVSNEPRLDRASKIRYFEKFLGDKPSGKIDRSEIELGCNTAVDSGLYTFSYRGETKKPDTRARYTFTYRWNGSKWQITSHHSSAMPEKEDVTTPVEPVRKP